MNLSQLRFAVSLAATKSFTAAAAACFVTQPTLSGGIAELEEELGQKLFVRTTRRVALTPFGADMLPAIAEVVRAQDALVQRAKTRRPENKSVVRIGTSPLIDAGFLEAILDPFRRQHGEVGLVLREMNLDDLYARLAEGELDFAFGVADMHRIARSRRMVRAALYQEPLLYVPKRFESAAARDRAPIAFHDIAGETFVMVPDACGLARATKALFRRHRRPFREYSGQAMSYQVLEQWAGLGIGAAVLPKSKVSVKAAARPIVDAKGEPVMIAFEAVWPRAAGRAAHVLSFARHLRESASMGTRHRAAVRQ